MFELRPEYTLTFTFDIPYKYGIPKKLYQNKNRKLKYGWQKPLCKKKKYKNKYILLFKNNKIGLAATKVLLFQDLALESKSKDR